MSTRATLARDFWDSPLCDLFQTMEATPAGLTSDDASSLTVSASEIRLPYPVSPFFQFDPLVTISNALASRALYRGLLRQTDVLSTATTTRFTRCA